MAIYIYIYIYINFVTGVQLFSLGGGSQACKEFCNRNAITQDKSLRVSSSESLRVASSESLRVASGGGGTSRSPELLAKYCDSLLKKVDNHDIKEGSTNV